MENELVENVKLELGLQDNLTDEVILLYTQEGEKQLRNYLQVKTLTSTLLLLVKGYAVHKMKWHNNKYVESRESYKGLDVYFKDHIHTIDLYSSFKNSTTRYLKTKDRQRSYAIEKSIEKRKKK